MNNDNKIFNDKVKKHRRLKFGALAVALTASVVAMVVIINVVFSSLAAKFLWYVDMTRERLYGITQASIDLLDDYRGVDDFKIKIIFCTYADQLDGSSTSALVHTLAKQYEKEFDYISVEYVDIINHPEAVDKYLTTTESKPKTTSVIITDGAQSRLFSIQSFYTFDSDSGNLFAFNGEYKITSTILQFVGEKPLAYFVTGHGESINGTVMFALFEDAGYDVRTIDLSKENLDDAAKVVVINNPQSDFLGAEDSANEIKKISDFLGKFGGLMVFMDANDKQYPELDSLLAEWGIKFEKSLVTDYSNSLSVDGKELVAEYTTSGTGSSLTTTIREMESIPKTIVKNARPIKLLYDTNVYGSSQRLTSTVLQTSSAKTAEETSLTDTSTAPVKGVYNLMTITVDSRYISNEPHFSYVLAAGTASFADDKYIGRASYGNRNIIFNVMKNFSKKTVPLDINFKVFEKNELNITKAQANKYTVICTVVLPLIVFAVGIVVYSRRRYL